MIWLNFPKYIRVRLNGRWSESVKKTLVLSCWLWCFGGKCLLEAVSVGAEIELGVPSSLWEELLEWLKDWTSLGIKLLGIAMMELFLHIGETFFVVFYWFLGWDCNKPKFKLRWIYLVFIFRWREFSVYLLSLRIFKHTQK